MTRHAVSATDITELQQLLDWKLLKGSHEWPGPDGGTCILEAAIVVAGRPYRAVRSSIDAPEDFSWVMSEYLLHLNDYLPDGARQCLIPFTTRLAGSAGCKEVEQQRRELVLSETVKHIFATLLGDWGRKDHATVCRTVPAGWPAIEVFYRLVPMLRRAMSLPKETTNGGLPWAAEVAVLTAARFPEERRAIMERVTTIADAALNIGKRAEPVEIGLAVDRLERARLLPRPDRKSTRLNSSH